MEKKQDKIKHTIDEIDEIEVKSIVVESSGYIRLYPNHNVSQVGKASIGKKFADVEIVEGTNVANGNKWYKVKLANGDGYIHSSYVREI